jgi:hypothetical protein
LTWLTTTMIGDGNCAVGRFHGPESLGTRTHVRFSMNDRHLHMRRRRQRHGRPRLAHCHGRARRDGGNTASPSTDIPLDHDISIANVISVQHKIECDPTRPPRSWPSCLSIITLPFASREKRENSGWDQYDEHRNELQKGLPQLLPRHGQHVLLSLESCCRYIIKLLYTSRTMRRAAEKQQHASSDRMSMGDGLDEGKACYGCFLQRIERQQNQLRPRVHLFDDLGGLGQGRQNYRLTNKHSHSDVDLLGSGTLF